MNELTALQLMIIGAIAAVIAQLVKLWAAKSGKAVPQLILSLVIFGVSLVLAYLWARPAIPAWPAPVADPMAYALLIIGWIGQLIVLAGTLLGFAKVVYDSLLKTVFEKINLGGTKISELATTKVLADISRVPDPKPYTTNLPGAVKKPDNRK